jgi:hypothetical protein
MLAYDRYLQGNRREAAGISLGRIDARPESGKQKPNSPPKI